MTTLPKFMGGALTLPGCARKTDHNLFNKTHPGTENIYYVGVFQCRAPPFLVYNNLAVGNPLAEVPACAVAAPTFPGKLELRAPQGATPVNLRMQALTAARFDDIYSCRITSNWKTAAVITVITAVITIQL